MWEWLSGLFSSSDSAASAASAANGASDAANIGNSASNVSDAAKLFGEGGSVWANAGDAVQNASKLKDSSSLWGGIKDGFDILNNNSKAISAVGTLAGGGASIYSTDKNAKLAQKLLNKQTDAYDRSVQQQDKSIANMATGLTNAQKKASGGSII